jgi:hypothetical protein
MVSTKQNALMAHRRRQKRQGIVRLEVQVQKSDVPLVRSVVGALADPKKGAEIRTLIRERVGVSAGAGLKALLVAAPLEGINLERPRDTGRAVDL